MTCKSRGKRSNESLEPNFKASSKDSVNTCENSLNEGMLQGENPWTKILNETLKILH